MGAVWSEQAKFQSWLDVEIAATEANTRLGRVPQEALDTIKAKASFEVERILEIEAEVRHDVIAFLTNVNEHVGDAGRHVHVGMTSSDVLDTGVALQLKRSVALRSRTRSAGGGLRDLARAHKGTEMIGRSHAIHGEPITFGFKVAGWLAETERNRTRLERLEQDVAVGQVSGWALCQHRSPGGGHRLRDPRPHPRHRKHPGDLPRSPCRLRADPRPGGRLLGLFHRDPQPATRCARGGGELRQGAEGQLRHAPQAQPDPQ